MSGPAPPPSDRVIDLPRHSTLALEWGSPEAPSVVLLHPLGLDRRAFGALAARLSPAFRCVAFDQRGHGAARAAGLEISLGRMAEDVGRVMDALNIARAHVVGHSMGGLVAGLAAAADPTRFSTLTLAAAPFEAVPAFGERAAAAERDGRGSWLDATLRRWFTAKDLAREPGFVAYARERLLDMSVADWAAAWRAMASFVGFESLGRCLPDAFIVSGTDDVSTPPSTMEHIARTTPRCRGHVRLEGGAHMLVLSHPDDLAAALASAWAGREAASFGERTS